MDTISNINLPTINLSMMRLCRNRRSAYMKLDINNTNIKLIYDLDINSSGDVTISYLIKYGSSMPYALVSLSVYSSMYSSIESYYSLCINSYYQCTKSLSNKLYSRANKYIYPYRDKCILVLDNINSTILDTIIKNSYSKVEYINKSLLR